MCASLGTFTTCTHERLSLYSSTESDWAPLTKSYLLASLCVLACPLAQELLKWERGSRWLMAWCWSFPTSPAHGKYLLFVTREQWGFTQEMDVECIYNIMLVWLLWTPNSISQLTWGSGGGAATQGEEFDFSEVAPEICKLDGFLGLFFDYLFYLFLSSHWRAKSMVSFWDLRSGQEPSGTYVSMVLLFT